MEVVHHVKHGFRKTLLGSHDFMPKFTAFYDDIGRKLVSIDIDKH
jgi:hypothetical protein